MTSKEKKLIFVSLLISALLVVGGYVYFLGATNTAVGEEKDIEKEEESITLPDNPPEVGVPGSEHAHMMFLVSIQGGFHDFDKEKYVGKSDIAHFHEGNDLIIHKHATGVTLPRFLDTLGVKLEDDCLTLDTGRAYCEDVRNKLTMIVNGDEIERPELYELQHGDRILLNYGPETRIDLKLKARSIPDMPREFLEDYEPPEEQ